MLAIIGVFLILIIMLIVWLIPDRAFDRYFEVFDPKYIHIDRLNVSDKPVRPNNEIILTFTTIPSRMKYIPNILEKIKKQIQQPDKIIISIPFFSKRKKVPYDVPEDWKFPDNVMIHRCEDYGPATKLLGCIPLIDDPDTMIITIDDDQDYDDYVLSTLVQYGIEYPDSCITFCAMDDNNKLLVSKPNKDILNCDYLEGYGGVLYRRKFIPNSMFDYFNNLSYDCFISDDLVISKWLNIQDINIIKVSGANANRKDDIDIDKNDPLKEEDRIGVYQRCKIDLNRLV